MPFIHRLKIECDGHDMASPVDYRRLAQHQRGLYFVTPSRDEDVYEAFIEVRRRRLAQHQRGLYFMTSSRDEDVY
jgi:hypothetical protein